LLLIQLSHLQSPKSFILQVTLSNMVAGRFGGLSGYFYKDIYTEENLRKMGLNEGQIRAVMYVKERGKVTNKEYQQLKEILVP